MTGGTGSLGNAVIKRFLNCGINGNSGDIFVQKASACTIGDLAVAVKELFEAKNEVKIIGTRHGEKLGHECPPSTICRSYGAGTN